MLADQLLKADVEVLIGALHQTTVENQLLRQQMTERTALLRSLPNNIGPGPSVAPDREVLEGGDRACKA
ncbi:hypothetical protein [Streptomyces sp. R41]|uniref:Integrase n=1 Tax=Streptomyces sp. R41 TaxID=3238632 RepID=A0AB39RX72_9ACTN